MSNEIETGELNRAGRRAAGRADRKHRRMRVAGAALTAGAATFGTTAALLNIGAAPAGAATLTVTNLNPSGAGSLHDIAEAANDTDVIVFQAGLTGTITLADTINIDTSIEIQGPGAGVVTVSGNDAVQIFNIDGPRSSSRIDVTISGLTLIEGEANFGGAIRFSDANLTVRDSVLTDNHATASGGGAIGTNDNDEDLVIENSQITGNTADGNGGGIYFYSADGGNFTMTNSSVSGANTADGSGGGVWIKGEGSNLLNSVTITDSDISGNTAEDGDGGGLFVYYVNSVSITNTTITGNTASSDGGGAFLNYIDVGLDITGSTISGNTAEDGKGGGLFVYYVFGDVNIKNTTIGTLSSPNTATDAGGGAFIYYVTGDLTIENCTISGNSSFDAYGGGLYITDVDGVTTIAYTTIADNDAVSSGGGIELYENELVVIRNSTISGNHTDNDGGGIYISSSNYAPVEIYNSTISGNTADGEGGGIAFNSYYGLTIVQSTIANNTATTFGGIYMGAEAEPVAAKADAKAAKASEKSTHQAEKQASAQAEGKAHTKDVKEKQSRVRAAASQPHNLVLSGAIVAVNSGTDIGDLGTATAKGSLIGTISGTTLVDQGGNRLGVNPLLGVLANNGGPTQTHALLPGSPAIDAGPNPLAPFTGSEFDQRGLGFLRVIAGVVDMGAFEVQPIVITPKFTG